MTRRISFATILQLSLVLVACALLAGCQRDAAQRVATAIAQLEQIDFNFIVLQADSNERYHLAIDSGSGCTDYLFSRSELAEMLVRGSWDVTRTVGAHDVTSRFPFSFEQLEPCVTAQEVVIGNDQLSIPRTDEQGTVIGRQRELTIGGGKLVDASLSNNGQLEVRLRSKGINMVGTTVSRSRAAGPVVPSRVEFDGTLFSLSAGNFAAEDVIPVYAVAEIRDVLNDPKRFTATFSFLAARPADTSQLVLVWDGDMVMRTDL